MGRKLTDAELGDQADALAFTLREKIKALTKDGRALKPTTVAREVSHLIEYAIRKGLDSSPNCRY